MQTLFTCTGLFHSYLRIYLVGVVVVAVVGEQEVDAKWWNATTHRLITINWTTLNDKQVKLLASLSRMLVKSAERKRAKLTLVRQGFGNQQCEAIK